MSTVTSSPPSVAGYVEHYIEAWHQHDPEAVVAMHTPDTVFTSTSSGLEARGRDELRMVLTDLFSRWPDIRFSPQRTYADGDVVCVESIISVTQACPMTFAGLEIQPTDQQVQVSVVDLIHLRDGLVADKHSYLDELGYLRQMGYTVQLLNQER